MQSAMIGFGRYNLLLTLGQGGMGSVFLARQKTLRRFCAIKVINPQFSQDKEAAERFLREARAAASLSHPNLVSIFDCDLHDGKYFIAMEYVEGLGLAQILRKNGPLPLPLALYWLQQAAIGLEYIHGKGVVHRDIKPDNMIVDASGLLKIMDLGLAKHHFEGDQSMTTTGMAMGSPHYMSPEQINDSKTVDHRTDIYSLGISFYQMIVGRVPFPQTSATAVCIAHLQEPIPSIAFPDPAITRALDDLIGRMAAKDANERFQSATDLLATLASWIESNPRDAASDAFFSNINFAERKVAHLLEKEGVNPSEMDADIPVASASGEAPVRKPDRNLKWIIAFIAVLLIIGIGIGIRKKKSHRSAPTDSAQQTVAPPSTSSASPFPSRVTAPETPQLGGLYVETRPRDAAVIFRGAITNSPAMFSNVPGGKYPVKVALPGYRKVEQEVEIVGGDVKVLKMDMERIQGSVTIESVPSGADVISNGNVIGRTPFTAQGMDGGKLDFVLHLPGYYDANASAQLTENGGAQSVTLNPRPKPAGGASASGAPQTPESSHDSSMEQRHRRAIEKWNQILEATRRIPTLEWPDQKRKLLVAAERGLRREGATDPEAIRFAIGNVTTILGQARAMTPGDFNVQKRQLVQEIVQNLERSLSSVNR